MSIAKATSTDDLRYADVIDLRDLLDLRDDLQGRTRCDVCGEETLTVVDENGDRVLAGHAEDDEYDHQAEIADPLDEDEAELLAEIERFDAEEVNGDVRTAHSADSPTLIAESYWETYAEEDANELMLPGVPENVRFYFDYEKWARDYRHDFEEVTLAGETFLRRSF